MKSKGYETTMLCGCTIKFHQTIWSISNAWTLKTGNYILQPYTILQQRIFQRKQVISPTFTGYRRQNNLRMYRIPFRRKQFVSGMYLSYYTLMNHLIEKCTFFRSDGRCTEFYFYCCHTKLFLKINITKRKLIDIEWSE